MSLETLLLKIKENLSCDVEYIGIKVESGKIGLETKTNYGVHSVLNDVDMEDIYEILETNIEENEEDLL